MSRYPTEEELSKIQKASVSSPVDVACLLDEIERLWEMPEWGFRRRGRKFELHTGGWSGNESIVSALQNNVIFWAMFWEKSVCGGHLYFVIPDYLYISKRKK